MLGRRRRPCLEQGFLCDSCGEWHPEAATAFFLPAPDAWLTVDHDPESILDEEICRIDVGETSRYFVRGNLDLPILTRDEALRLTLWVELSENDAEHMFDRWYDADRVDDPPYQALLGNNLPGWDEVLALSCTLQTGELGVRPIISLDPLSHNLYEEWARGISAHRAVEIAQTVQSGLG